MATRGRKSAAAQKLTIVGGVGARLTPPAHMPLDPDMQAVWDDIVNSLPADYFRPGDGPLLAAYCMATVFYTKAAGEVAHFGPTLMDDKGRSYGNPAQQLLVTQASTMAQLAVKLRLCPSARYSTKSASTKTDNAGAAKKPWQVAG